jgi:predicted RNase H-like HicB family nuclease
MLIPPLTAIIEQDGPWFVVACPELDVVSQGSTAQEAEKNIQEAVELLLETAGEAEIARRLGRNVQIEPINIANA